MSRKGSRFNRAKVNPGKFSTTSAEVLTTVREMTDKVLLSFSMGKDSITTWITLREAGFIVIPIYHYYIPKLEFVEQSLNYYEDKFQTHIVRIPHSLLITMLEETWYQTPATVKVLDEVGIPDVTTDELYRRIAKEHGLGHDAWCAAGMRAFDSVMRYVYFKKHGPINRKRHLFYPIFDWKKDAIISKLQSSGVKLPIDYRYFHRSFEGPRPDVLPLIKKHFPRDYERILLWFPLAHAEGLRLGEIQET